MNVLFMVMKKKEERKSSEMKREYQTHIPREEEDKQIERVRRKQGELEMVILVNETLANLC